MNREIWKKKTSSRRVTLGAWLLGGLLLGASGCDLSPGEEEGGICPDENRVLVHGHKYCVMDQTIIEKGFTCPADLSYRHELPQVRGVACSDQRTLPVGDIDPLEQVIRDPGGPWIKDPEPLTCLTPDPSKQGCRTDAECGASETCQPSGDTACVPSTCSCDTKTGDWICTEDCGELRECVAQPTCAGPNPAAQQCATDADCAAGEQCLVSLTQECVPSACSCDAQTGSWLCTADCGERRACVAVEDPAPCSDGSAIVCDAVAPSCPAGLVRETVNGCFGQCVDPQTCQSPVAMCNGQPDPSYQQCDTDADCASGDQCLVSVTQECVPSSCACDPGQGWTCTDDCGQRRMCGNGGSTEICGDGSVVVCDALPPTCPSGQIAPVINGCYGACVYAQTCQSPVELCNGQPDPSYQPCDTDADCGSGSACLPTGDAVCVPSSCACDEDNGWACTEDCGSPMACQPVEGELCNGQPNPNPSECASDSDCASGEQCVVQPGLPDQCIPSGCSCDGNNGWLCTADCSGVIRSCEVI